MQPEARISRAIQKMIKERGGFAFKVHGSEHMMAGLPDIVACYRGVWIGFETKTPTGKVSARQAYVHRMIERAEGLVTVPRSVADASNVLDAVDTYMDRMEERTGALSAGLRKQIKQAEKRRARRRA